MNSLKSSSEQAGLTSSVFDDFSDGVLIINEAKDITYANQRASELLGTPLRKLKKVNLIEKDIFQGNLSISKNIKKNDKEDFFKKEIQMKVNGVSQNLDIHLQSLTLDEDKKNWLIILRDLDLEIRLCQRYEKELKTKSKLVNKLQRITEKLSEQTIQLENYLLLLLSFIYGSSFIAFRYSVETIPPFLSVGARCAIASIALVAFHFLWLKRPLQKEELFTGFTSGLLRRVLFLGCVAWALKSIPSGVTAILVATSPLWIALLEVTFRGLKLFRINWIGLALGVTSVVLILFDSISGNISYSGLFLAVIATLGNSLGAFLCAKKSLNPLSVLMVESIIASIFLIGISWFSDEMTHFTLDQISDRTLISFLFLLVFTNLIGDIGMLWAMSTSSNTRGATFMFVAPVIALFIGSLIGKEEIGATTYFASLILFASINLVRRKKNKTKSVLRWKFLDSSSA